jgi:hypothetical protein
MFLGAGCVTVPDNSPKPQWRISQEAVLERLCDTQPFERRSFFCDPNTDIPKFDKTFSVESVSVDGDETQCTHRTKIGFQVFDITLKKKAGAGYCIVSMVKV